MSRTYVENNVVTNLPADYTEEALQKKFAGKMETLREELEEYDLVKSELDKINSATDWQDTQAEKIYTQQELHAEYLSLYRSQKPLQKEYDETRMNSELLSEYGTTFAQLYRIKDSNEKYGNPEDISFVEVDITDNGDMLTQDQYFKMRADPEGRLRQLALHIEDEEEDLDFNVGMMEYNQPNTPPQTKMQLSFDEETLEKIEESKLKAIFSFCEAHGLSTVDMEIRHFDGSLAEAEIQERINKGLEKIKKEKEAEAAAESTKEAEQQRERQKALEEELQNIQTARGGDLPTEELLSDISSDLPREGTVVFAASTAEDGEAKSRVESKVGAVPEAGKTVNTDFRGQKNIQKLAVGVATAAIPEDKVPDGIEVVSIEQTKSVPEKGTDGISAVTAGKSADANSENTANAEQINNKRPELSEKAAVLTEAQKQNEMQSSAVTEISENPKQSPAAEQTGINSAVAAAAAEHFAENQSNPLAESESSVRNQAMVTPQSVSVPQAAAQNAAQGQNAPTARKKTRQKEVETKFEKFLQEGLSKSKGSSYFKSHTGWFGTGWTEYVVYDNEDPDNRKKDGLKTKDGSVKYTYAFKLFLKVDNSGNVDFAYRTPNHRKLDETVVGGIVGQLKDLGNTYISFPPGLPKDDEKGMWRKAMAENGIVPIGMGLNKAKAEGMLKAAKEKLSAEAFATFQYRLAKQMQENNIRKGKPVDESEQIFIDGLLNTHKYSAFTDAYSRVYKSKIKKILRSDNPQEGAIDKIAAYRTLRKVFDVYKSAIEHGGNIMNADGLTTSEKQQLRHFISGPVDKLNEQQMNALYDVLYKRQRSDTDKRLCDEIIKQGYSDINVRGAKATPKNIMKDELNGARDSCDSINDDLAALGIEKIEIIKIPNVRMDFERFFNVDLPAYRRSQPQNLASSSSAHSLGQNTAGETRDVRMSKTAQKVVESVNEEARKADNAEVGAELIDGNPVKEQDKATTKSDVGKSTGAAAKDILPEMTRNIVVQKRGNGLG